MQRLHNRRFATSESSLAASPMSSDPPVVCGSGILSLFLSLSLSLCICLILMFHISRLSLEWCRCVILLQTYYSLLFVHLSIL